MPDQPSTPSTTGIAAQRRQLALQVMVLTRLRVAAAQAESWATLKMLSTRLAKARAELAALQREA